MKASRLPERSNQSPTRLVCSIVKGGSTSIASVTPEIRVVESGDHCRGAPLGSVAVVGICAETNTSYDSAAFDSIVITPPIGWCGHSGRTTVNEFPFRLCEVVEKLLDGLAYAIEPSRLRRGQVRTVDVPGLGRRLVAGDPILHRRAMNSWITLAIAQPQIHGIRNLRREVVDVRVKVAVVGRREEQLRVVVHGHEAHVVDCAYRVRRLEVPFHQLQQAAKPLRSAFRERNEQGELRDLVLPGTDTTGGLRAGWRCQFLRECGEPVRQRSSAQFRRVGVQLPELLKLFVDREILFLLDRCCCLRSHRCSFRSTLMSLTASEFLTVAVVESFFLHRRAVTSRRATSEPA